MSVPAAVTRKGPVREPVPHPPPPPVREPGRPPAPVGDPKPPPRRRDRDPEDANDGPHQRGARSSRRSSDDATLPDPHDPSTVEVAAEPDHVVHQAKRDLDEGQVDTDMHATPGLDHEQRKRLVPTPAETRPAPPPAKRGRPGD